MAKIDDVISAIRKAQEAVEELLSATYLQLDEEGNIEVDVLTERDLEQVPGVATRTNLPNSPGMAVLSKTYKGVKFECLTHEYKTGTLC